MSDEWVDEPLLSERLRAVLDESKRVIKTRDSLATIASAIEPPLGTLLTVIATAYKEMDAVMDAGYATDAECQRMERIVDAAVEAARWLTGAS